MSKLVSYILSIQFTTTSAGAMKCTQTRLKTSLIAIHRVSNFIRACWIFWLIVTLTSSDKQTQVHGQGQSHIKLTKLVKSQWWRVNRVDLCLCDV